MTDGLFVLRLISKGFLFIYFFFDDGVAVWGLLGKTILFLEITSFIDLTTGVG